MSRPAPKPNIGTIKEVDGGTRYPESHFTTGLTPRHQRDALLFHAGIHPKQAQDRMGHSTIRLTMDTYTHVLPEMQWEPAAKEA